jgi:hypothetical protein
MTTISSERAELMARLTDLESADFAARFRDSSLEQLRIAVRECAAQSEIYRKLGLVDASKAA